MNETERIGVVRCMILALAAPPGKENELLEFSNRSRKRLRDGGEENGDYICMKFAIKGFNLCREGFLAVTQISSATLHRHAVSVSSNCSFEIYSTERFKGRKGKTSVQTDLAIAFLKRYGMLHGLPCPRGRGSSSSEPLRMLPSGTTKNSVFMEYKKEWINLIEAAIDENRPTTSPHEPLKYFSFIKIWNAHFSTLKMFKGGSDYCDKCTGWSNNLKVEVNEEEKKKKNKILQEHKERADQEYRNYLQEKSRAASNPGGSVVHAVFDFAEKVLLPSMKRQPGNLHFTTGLKFDLFGVSSSNCSRNFIFGLPEGHWPSGKTADEVLSMVHHIVNAQKADDRTKNARKYYLHADNCAGQNKNRFILWYLCWLVCAEIYDEVTLHFLVAGHTKKVCDGVFGHVKRKFRSCDVLTLSDMMKVIDESALTSQCVPASLVVWKTWKGILSDYFTIPNALKITEYRVFSFSKGHPGCLFVKEFSNSMTKKMFCLLRSAQSPKGASIEISEALEADTAISKWPNLQDVKSAKEGNRHAYLKRNVCEKNFRNDRLFEEQPSLDSDCIRSAV